MKKVLIISHFWPYRSGSRRMLGLTKYLMEFNWQPIIITGPLNIRPDFDVRYEEVDYPCLFGFKTKKDIGDQLKEKSDIFPLAIKYYFLKLIYNFIREILAYPDEDKYWRKPAVAKAIEIIEKEKIDAIISIWPVTSHLIAKEIKDKYEQGFFGERKKIPWIVDFPDLWSENCDYSYSFIRKLFDRRLEKNTLKKTDALIVLSKYDKEKQQLIHKNKAIYVIPHGFNLEEINEPPQKITEKFTITYPGVFYAGKRDPSKILIALKDLINEKFINPEDIEIRFYGSREKWVSEIIKKYNLSEIVKQYGQIPRDEAVKKERESQILLLLKWEDPKEKGIYSGKIFEYLAARRPILATGGSRDVVSELLEETKAGIDAPTIKEIKEALKSLYFEYKKNGKVSFSGDIEKINKYSEFEMAKKFAVLLNKLINANLMIKNNYEKKEN